MFLDSSILLQTRKQKKRKGHQVQLFETPEKLVFSQGFRENVAFLTKFYIVACLSALIQYLYIGLQVLIG